MSEFKPSAQLTESYAACIESLTWSLERAKKFIEAFDRCVQGAIELRGQGISFNHLQNPIKAIDSFVNTMPDGGEQGNYYAIDVGGTNVRAVCVGLSGKGQSTAVQKEQNIRELFISDNTPKGLLDKNTPAVEMFDTIAKLTKDLMFEVGDNPQDHRLISLTFSFPVNQRALASGHLIEWTKEFETGRNTNDPVEGQDVAELLNASFRRQKMGCVVGAITNDTVGTLLSAGYEHNKTLPVARVGIILGTGFNIAAYDPATQKNNYVGNIVNLECGNYDGVADGASMLDMELDYHSANPGMQLAEKMISGHYLGEICRLAILKVFQFRCPQEVWRRGSFPTPSAAQIYADNTKRYKITHQVMKDTFKWVVEDDEELRMLYKLVCAIFDRSATISALMTAVVADRTKYLQAGLGGVTVGVDGSLYLKNAKYRKTYRKTIDKILGTRADLVKVVEASDGSGKGAAVMAACLGKH